MWEKRRTKCGSYMHITGEAGKSRRMYEEEGSKDGEKAEKEDTPAWDKL
jgi:hypothetical protein